MIRRPLGVASIEPGENPRKPAAEPADAKYLAFCRVTLAGKLVRARKGV